MKKITTRSALLSVIVAVVGVLVPQAGASLGGQSAPIGIAVYPSVDSVICGSNYTQEPDGNSFGVYICAGRNVSLEVSTDADAPVTHNLGFPIYVYVEHCTFDADCNGGSFTGNLTPAQFTIDPALGTGSIHADVEGCRVDLSATATGLPANGSLAYKGLDPNGRVRLNLFAVEALYRPATWAGSVCGQPTAGGTGVLAHLISGNISAYAGTAAAS